MQTIDDIIQSVARARTRPDGNPILFWRSLSSDAGQRISHLSVSNELGQAWVAMMGEPFRPHQAHALTLLRRNESLALRSESATLQHSLFLLIGALFEADRAGVGLIVTDDDYLAEAIADTFDQINKSMPSTLRLALDVVTPQTRFHPQLRLLVCPAELLHTRLLGHHDRAWAPFWSRLRLLALPEVQRFRGVAGTHLSELIRRAQRIAMLRAGNQVPLLATLPPMLDAEPALNAIANQPLRVINADDSGQHAGLIVVWRSGFSLMRDIADLAAELNRHKVRVHVLCNLMEQAALQPALGDMSNVTSGPQTQQGTVLICVGVPESLTNLRRLMRSGHETVILVLGELLHEHQLARQAELVLTAPATTWTLSPPNAYVVARHLMCAASELDLQAEEVAQWGLQQIVDHLLASGHLSELPDTNLAWKAGPQADDPYLDMSLNSASGAAIDVFTEAGHLVASLDPTALERWAFPGAALPPLRGGLGVLVRDEETGRMSVRTESSGRRTFPVRRCQVKPRDQGQSRVLLGGMTLRLVRVVVDEVIEGYREYSPGNQALQKKLNPVLTSQWAAPACCFKLTSAPSAAGQLVGWSLIAAVCLQASADIIDLVPCYDEANGLLYFVDTQPGGSGLAAWIYENAEQLFQLAFDIAYAGRHDPLIEGLCRNDRDWLQVVLGKAAAPTEANTVFVTAPADNQPFIELPPARTVRPDVVPPAPQSPVTREQPVARETPPAATPKPPVAPPQPPAPEPRETPPASPKPAVPEQPAARETPPASPKPVTQETPPAPTPRASVPEKPPIRKPAAPPAPKAPEPEEATDAAALIARLRRQREQREKEQPEVRRAATPRKPSSSDPLIQRFKRGDHVLCLPYGDGVVYESRIDQGHEILIVTFPDYGDLEIDPEVNLVRHLKGDAPEPDDLL